MLHTNFGGTGRANCLTRASPATLLPLPRIGGEGWGEGVRWQVERSAPSP